MKKARITFIIIMLAAWITPCGLLAGKPFEGIITYKISYPDSKFTESQLAMFPKLVTVMIKGTKSKTEYQTNMGNQTEISDYAEKTKIALINMMGQKYAIKQTAEEIEKENAKEPKATVEMTNETKTIAGYLCKKAVVTQSDNGTKTTFDVFYTSDLGSKVVNFDNPIYKEIDGVLMEFSMKTPQISMKFTASSVEKKTIAAKEFDIPADYTLTTKEELRTKFGGGME
jgi:hypothetical protein